MTTDQLYSILMKAKCQSHVIFQNSKDESLFYCERYERTPGSFIIYVGNIDKFKAKRLRNLLVIPGIEVRIIRIVDPDIIGYIVGVEYYDFDNEVIVYYDD